MDQDLTTYLEKAPDPGVPPETIKVNLIVLEAVRRGYSPMQLWPVVGVSEEPEHVQQRWALARLTASSALTHRRRCRKESDLDLREMS